MTLIPMYFNYHDIEKEVIHCTSTMEFDDFLSKETFLFVNLNDFELN